MRLLADSRRGVVLLAGALTILVTGVSVSAQPSRSIVAKTVVVGSAESSLALDFDDGSRLAIQLSDGEVAIDGATVGAYRTAGALDAAWRSLLTTAVGIDGTELAAALVEWAPPEGLPSEAAEPALAIDRALEEALSRSVAAAPPTAGAPDAATALRSLLTRAEDPSQALAGLSEAMRGVDLDGLEVIVGSPRSVGRDEVVEASVLIVDGDLQVAGRVRGDVVVVDGDVQLLDTGRIDGDVRLVGGDLIADGRIDGEILRIDPASAGAPAGLRDEWSDELRDEIRTELRSELRAASRAEQRRGNGAFSRAIAGIGGAIGQLLSVVVIGLIGAAVVHFAERNLDAVAETARRTPARAVLVGTAGAFLILPAFALGAIVLAVSIIGIPALLLWVPLFPAAIILGALLGYLAIFRNVGAWVARQRAPYLGWVRLSNPVTLVVGGALAVAAPSIAAELVSVIPWTGALEMVLRASALVVWIVAGLLGFGAVLLTRAGHRPEFYDDDFFGGWSPARPPRPTPPPTAENEAGVETYADEPGHAE